MQWSYRVEGDDATRTATVYDQYNNVVETRPYTDLENAAADARALNDTRAENEATLNSGLSEQIDNAIARKDAMAAIKAMTNADINANPARIGMTIRLSVPQMPGATTGAASSATR